MISIFITIAICFTFIIEARKRNQSSFKWTLIGLGAFWGPMLAISLIAIPLVIIVTNTPIDESHNIQLIFNVSGFVLGFYLVVKARKRLFSIELVDSDPNEIVVTSLNVVENDDGTFTAANKTFTTRYDAEEYINLLKRTAS